MTEYYISSNKYNLQTRETKLNGTVYDVVFNIITPQGERKQKRLSGYKSKVLARQAYVDFVTSKCELVKNNPLIKKKVDKQVPLVGDLLREYLISLSNQNKGSTIYDKENVYRQWILPKYENSKITDLTKEELYRWQDELWATKNPRNGEYYTYKYLFRIRTHFAVFLEWTHKRYGYPNYLTEVEKPRNTTVKREMDFWTEKEFTQFINAVDDAKYRALFTMLFYTGRRKGEILALTPKKIKKGFICFDSSITRKVKGQAWAVTTTKTYKAQNIPICPRVQKLLAEYKGEAPFLFGGERPLAENTLTRAFDRYIKKSGVKRIRVHDLRHSFVSMLIHHGANLTVVAHLIGDTLEQVTKTYAHMYEEDEQAILKELG